MRRLAIGAAAFAALALAPPAQAARIETWTTASGFLDERPLKVNVLLPDGYDGGKRRFRVLYLLHGHGGHYDDWAKPGMGEVRSLVDGLDAIVVMPEGANGWYADWWMGGARRPGWESYHLNELIPMAERRLRIARGRRNHAIAGLSMGGGGAVYYATQRPGYFGSAAALSGVLSSQRPEWPAAFDTQGERHTDVFGDPERERFYWSGHNPRALVDNLSNTRLYVAVGDGTTTDPAEADETFAALAEAELRRHAEDFVPAARAAGADVTYRPRRGIHTWQYWRADLRDAIAWGFFGHGPAKPTRWTYSTVARRTEAHGFRFLFTNPPGELETFRLDGRRMSATGSGTVRVRTPSGRRFTAALPFERRVR